MITIITQGAQMRPYKKCKSELGGNDMDGVIQFTDLSQQSSIYGNPLDTLTYYADGPIDDYDQADGPIDDYSNAGGIKRAFSNMRANRKEKLRIKRLKQESKAAARVNRSKAKMTSSDAKKDQAKAQQIAARNAGKDDSAAVAAALAATPAAAESTGRSTGAKVGIGLGIAAVIGIVAFVIYKNKKK